MDDDTSDTWKAIAGVALFGLMILLFIIISNHVQDCGSIWPHLCPRLEAPPYW